MHIDPTEAQLTTFASQPGAEPLFMLNLLRVRPEADGMAGVSGLEAYLRYADATQPHLERVGAVLVWAGTCDTAVIGPDEPEWDVAAVVRYPSRAAFLAMISDPEYLEISRIRSASLADSRLIPCAGSPMATATEPG